MTINTEKLAFAVQLKRGKRSLRDAAKESGIPFSTLNRIENEGNAPDLDNYMKLCDWLNVSADFFRNEATVEAA